jgi:glycosyltransferase involved in cell wall biosynthesis
LFEKEDGVTSASTVDRDVCEVASAVPTASKIAHSVSLVCYGYNEEDLIAAFFQRAVGLLDSVVTDYEIIYIDDCSTDHTWEIAQRFARNDSRLRVWRNDRNRNIGYSFKRAVSLAEKEYLFWQTIDWSYDLSNLGIFLALLDHFGMVIGVRPVPVRLLAYIPVVRSIYRVRTRSDNFIRAMVSLANYYVLRILFGLDVHDFQNIQFHRTKMLQSFKLHGESSFLGIEIMIRACNCGLDLVEVPIRFIPRTKGVSKGIRPAAIWKSCRDIARNWFAWGWRVRREGWGGRRRIYRLTEPAFLSEEVIVLCAPLFKQFR